MKTLDELETGDEIVVSGYNNKLAIVTVTKITKTQITAGNVRYNRRSGDEIGSSPSWHGRPHIVVTYQDYNTYVLDVAKGRQLISRQQEETHKRKLAREIGNTHWEVFNHMNVEDLEAFVALINKAMQPDEATL